jgi:hypothetical protein
MPITLFPRCGPAECRAPLRKQEFSLYAIKDGVFAREPQMGELARHSTLIYTISSRPYNKICLCCSATERGKATGAYIRRQASVTTIVDIPLLAAQLGRSRMVNGGLGG